jgi:hypothetical protein
VVAVIALFEVWFFFYSPSPIDQRTGRSHTAPLIGAATVSTFAQDRPQPDAFS